MAIEPNMQARRTPRQQCIDELPARTASVLDKPYGGYAATTEHPDSAQTLDLYIPAGSGPFPLIVWIHGGGWHSLNKDLSGAEVAQWFIPAGFAVASLNYRLTVDSSPFPAQIEDCFMALAWLRSHSADYRLNPDKIGVYGHSAGAHLAALLAVTGGSNLFTKENPELTRVQAAVLWSGPFDLGRERGKWPKSTFAWDSNDPYCRTFFPSAQYDEPFACWASPSSYIQAGIPPVLAVHGGKDSLVPPGQAAGFIEALKSKGIQAILRLYPERGHEWDAADTREVLEFFRQTLS